MVKGVCLCGWGDREREIDERRAREKEREGERDWWGDGERKRVR